MSAGRNRVSQRIHAAGTSLIELMVVMFIFLIAISAVLSFYISSRQVYKFSDEASQFERNSSRLMDLLERELPPSRVLEASGNYIIYRRMRKGDLGGPLLNGRFPEFEAENTVIYYEDDTIIQRAQGRDIRLFTMGLDGTVSFGLSRTSKELYVNITGKPRNATISNKSLSISNMLVLTNSTQPR